jgi:glyoxylase-like metal-dependent hydrolase (beta-lactamase superfamily II)
MRIIQDAPALFRLSRFGMFNCFLVQEDDGFTLVDTNFPGSAPQILQAAKKLDAPIRRILLTHAHFDHIGSLDELASSISGAEIGISLRESRLLARDFTLDQGESGRPLLGFPGTKTQPTILLGDGDRIGSLQVISSPGHSPGHLSFLDLRDGSVLAGDTFVNQFGLTAAGVFKFYFPMPALFSWNKQLSALSAKKLRDLKPVRLALGHGDTLLSPLAAMDEAVDLAFHQCPNLVK